MPDMLVMLFFREIFFAIVKNVAKTQKQQRKVEKILHFTNLNLHNVRISYVYTVFNYIYIIDFL